MSVPANDFNENSCLIIQTYKMDDESYNRLINWLDQQECNWVRSYYTICISGEASVMLYKMAWG